MAVHQPPDAISCAGSSDVNSRPIVGISHAIPMMTSTMLTGAWLSARTMLRPTPSRGDVSTRPRERFVRCVRPR